MTTRLCRLLVLVWALALTALSFGQIPNPVKWKFRLEPANPAPGARAEIVMEGTVEEPWHLYSTTPVENGPFATQISAKVGGSVAEVGKPTQSNPLRKLDPNFKVEVEYYEKSAEFRLPVRIAKTAKGASKIAAEVIYQVCDEGTCLPPKKVPVEVAFTATGAPVDDTTPLNAAGTTTPVEPKEAVDTKALSDYEKAQKNGIFSFLLFAVGAGFFSLLTPCVFPMIPITVSFFSKRKDGENPVKKATAYCLGIIGTFTALGVFVSAVFGAAGLTTFANNPYLNLVLGIVFIALAFSLFGFFEIGVPSSILTKLDGSGRTGLVGPILMGLTFSLTSFTCTLPFVGTVLVSASQGSYIWPIMGMLGFSTAFALPFFLLALFPSALSKMPRSGAWLATVKAFMGFVELAAAVKFFSSVDLGIRPGGLEIITRPVFLAVWFGIAFLAALYLLGIIKLPKVDDAKIGLFRRAMGVVTLAAAGYILLAINGRSMGTLAGFLPPASYGGGASTERLTWIENYEQAVAEAKASGKPLFIDFTGQFCTNCRDMEDNMFPNPGVEERLKKFVRVRLYTDRLTPEDNKNQELLQKLTKSITLPTYVVVDPTGNQKVEAWTRDEQRFTRFLDSGLGNTRTAKR